MPTDDSWSDDAEDDFCDEEYPDEDAADDDETATLTCPHCGAEVYEDAEYCPVCDSYITPGENVFSKKPIWWILLGLAGIVATLVALAGILSW